MSYVYHRPPPAIPTTTNEVAFNAPPLPNRPTHQSHPNLSTALPCLPPRPGVQQPQAPPRPTPPVGPQPLTSSSSAPCLPPRPKSNRDQAAPPVHPPAIPQRPSAQPQVDTALPLPPRPAPPPQHIPTHHTGASTNPSAGERKLKKLPPLPPGASASTVQSYPEPHASTAKDVYAHYHSDSSEEFENYVTKIAAEAAADAALDEENQAKVGAALGSAAKNEVYQQKTADYLASHTDNKRIQSLLQNKTLQERTGRAFAAVAENKTVQHHVGNAVSESLRNEEAQQKVKEGVKKGSKRAFGWGKEAIKASLTTTTEHSHSDVC